MKIILSLTILSILLQLSYCYKPVMMVPGFMYPHIYFEKLKQSLTQVHPGTDIIVATFAFGELTEVPMWMQVDGTYNNKDVQAFLARNPDGFHIFCHSQGHMLSRALIEKYGLPVINFVSVAGVFNGLFGVPSVASITSLIGMKSLLQFSYKNLYQLMYTPTGQKTIFLAGVWKDPCHYELYLQNNIFLPVINNEVNHTDSAKYKENFLRISNLYVFGGPDDGVIVPWQSALGGFVDCNGDEILMKDLNIYKDDLYGLKTLDLRGGLHREVVPKVTHNDFSMEKFVSTKVFPLMT